MCTLIVAHHVHPAFPVVIAANRDEFYARPSTSPLVLSQHGPRIVGGRDGAKGGTWMGVNDRGLFVGITNQRTWHAADPTLRSRGDVVMGVLAQTSPDAMVSTVRSFDATTYNPFNLLFGDADAMYVAYFRHESPSIAVLPLPRGLHVLPNDVLDSREFPKVERAIACVTPALDGSFDELKLAMKSALRDHTKSPLTMLPLPPSDALFPPEIVRELSALCIHTPVYGTHSASFIALEPGRVAQYEFAVGPSCEHPFVDVRPLLDA